MVKRQKHTGIFIAALLAANLVFAQNTGENYIKGDHTDAYIQQQGNNEAWIWQYSNAANQGEKNTATILQWGYPQGNTAEILQGSVNTDVNQSHVWVQQHGDGNEAIVHQNTWSDGDWAISVIKQYGKDNRAKTYMQAGEEWIKPDYTRILQHGFDNYAYQLKEDDRGGTLLINQYNARQNRGNYAEQFARSGESGFLFIEQIGEENKANQDIYEHSRAITRQYGDENRSSILVPDGKNNDAFVLQTNDNNVADVEQFDNQETAKLRQFGGKNTATVEQSGRGNVSHINQTLGGEMTIFQSGKDNVVRGTGSTWAESLNGSLLDVEQYGAMNDLQLDQTGSTAKVRQNGKKNNTVIIQK